MKAQQTIELANKLIKSFQFSQRDDRVELIEYWNERKEIAQSELSNEGVETPQGKYNSPEFSNRESCKECGEYGV